MKFQQLLGVVFVLIYGTLVGFVSAQIQTPALNKTLTVNNPCQNHFDCNSDYNDRLNKTSFEYCDNNKMCRCGISTVFEKDTCLMTVESPCGADYPACARNAECRPWQRGLIKRCKCVEGFFKNEDQKCVHGLAENCTSDADCDFFNQKLKCGSAGNCSCASDQIFDKKSKQCKSRLRGLCQTSSEERNVLRCLEGLACIQVRKTCTMKYPKETKFNCVEEMRCLGEKGAACTILQDTCVPGTFCEADREGSAFGVCTSMFADFDRFWMWLIAGGILFLGLKFAVTVWEESDYNSESQEPETTQPKPATTATTTV